MQTNPSKKKKDMGPAITEAMVGAPLALYGAPVIALLGVFALGDSLRRSVKTITSS